MIFQPDRLTAVRESLGINKAEAARRLNMSAMGYGRYERGEREPSFPTVSFIAQSFGTTTDYLYGLSSDSAADTITISEDKNPELFALVRSCLDSDSTAKRLLSYWKKLNTEETS